MHVYIYVCVCVASAIHCVCAHITRIMQPARRVSRQMGKRGQSFVLVHNFLLSICWKAIRRPIFPFDDHLSALEALARNHDRIMYTSELSINGSKLVTGWVSPSVLLQPPSRRPELWALLHVPHMHLCRLRGNAHQLSRFMNLIKSPSLTHEYRKNLLGQAPVHHVQRRRHRT